VRASVTYYRLPPLDLHSAAANGGIRLIKCTLSHMKLIKSFPNGVLPQYATPSRGSGLVVKLLVDQGTDVDADRLPRCYSDHTRGNRIRDSVRQFSDRKYKSHWDNLFLSVGNWFRAMGEDLATKRFEEDWARLTRDLGCLKIALGLWNDIRWLSCRRLWIRFEISPLLASSTPTARSTSWSRTSPFPDTASFLPT